MSQREEKSVTKVEGRGPGGARLRVLVVAPSLDIYGGQARQAVRLMTGLSSEPSLEVGFLPHNPRLPGPLRWLQRIKYVRTVSTTIAYVLMVLARVPRYDVIHVFSAAYWSYLLSAAPALLVARLYGRRSILNYRSGEAEDHLPNWPRTGVPTMRWADVIVTPSGYLVDVFARHNLRARFIYNIVELDRFKFRERNPPRPVFLVSRLHEPLYNVACVLRAFAIIQSRYPEARLTVAADGYLRPELERLAFEELKLRNTEFIGFVPFERMPEMYDSADVYMTATNLDNMPSSITECMASGLPVVTTDAGGIPYIVTHEETCLMVGRDDPEAMAAAAFRLMEEEGLAAKLTRRAREESRKFEWPAVRDEWVRLYHELAQSKATGRLSAADDAAATRRSEA
ncbi:MAG TPA: glycosyltransferase family 4 protein [Pyrinomonadaceae bacterium]|jgi:glycosyltransferase involved in cell wall biosynthesis|nr:glycosyltransferase family 4 protein [Pyrinomonadaceae bacterium]